MIILGIDPGIAHTGFGVIRVEANDALRFIDSGVIKTEPGTPHDGRLRKIFEGISDIISVHRPDAVAIEGIFARRNLKTLAEVSESIGVITLAANTHGVGVKKFTPLEVKSAITGFGKAGKSQVQHMVRSMLGLEDEQQNHHASDALAVAICFKNICC